MFENLILPPLSNILGFVALALYFVTLQPGVIRVIDPHLLRSKYLMFINKYRRRLGVAAFIFGLLHGILMIQKKGLDLLDIGSYLNYWPGFLLLIIFTILAITSNQWSVSHLKQNWKKLHQITFLVIFVALIHIVDKVEVWTILTPVALTLVGISIAEFTWKKLEERYKKRSKL